MSVVRQGRVMSQSLTDVDRLSAALLTLLQAGNTEVSSSVSIS